MVLCCGGSHLCDVDGAVCDASRQKATHCFVKGGGPSTDCFYLFLCFMCIKQIQWVKIEEPHIVA